MRFLSFLGLAFIQVPASATFDLLLVPDEETNSVHRFHGATGQHLGEFGHGRLSAPQSVAVDPSNGRAYVASLFTNSIQVYHYSTGQFLNEFSVPGSPRSIVFSGGNLLIGGVGFLGRFSTSGSALKFFAPVGTQHGVVVGNDGHVYSYQTEVGKLHRFTSSGTLLFSADIPSSGSWARYQAMAYGNSVIYADGTANDIDFITADGTMPMTRSISVASAVVDVTGITAGQGQSAYVCGRLASNQTMGTIAPVNLMTGAVGQSFGSGVLKLPRGMASVAVPEPGTMLALSLGLLTLRRKKRSSSRSSVIE